ncbi:MAG: M56 family metallopeptidase [Gemmataceae bacterium]
MEDLLEIALSNAVAACVLALIAALVGRLARRPALTHALWLLVLAKLITPPFLTLHIPWAMPQREIAASAEPIPDPSDAGGELGLENSFLSEADLAELLAQTNFGNEPNDPTDVCPFMQPPLDQATPGPSTEIAAAPALPQTVPTTFNWQISLMVVWLVGAGCWFALAFCRVLRFHLLLRSALRANRTLQQQTDVLAHQLGMRSSPGVWLVPGFVSPMVWAMAGRACLILPAGLLKRLSEEQRATLLVHELAHLRRQDHWVRLLEVLVSGLFWWHPVVWWARREVREAEEQCCDAWVVWAMPDRARGYALTLLETVDFLSEARFALPPAASGIGYVHDLQRRMTMIMRGTTPRGLSWCGVLAVVGLAALLLPALPKLEAQNDPFGGDEQEQRAREEQANKARADLEAAKAQVEQARAQLKQAQAQADQARKQAAQQSQKARAAVNDFHAKLPGAFDPNFQPKGQQRQDSQDILAQNTCQRCHEGGKVKEGNMDPGFQKTHDAAIQLSAELKKLHEATDNTGRRLKEVMREMDRQSQGKAEKSSAGQPGAPARPTPTQPFDGRRAGQGRNADSDQRMHEFDKKMEMIMAELQALRQEMKERRPERGNERRNPRPDARPGTQPAPEGPSIPPRSDLAPAPSIVPPTPVKPGAAPVAIPPVAPSGPSLPAISVRPPRAANPPVSLPGGAPPSTPPPPGGAIPPSAPSGTAPPPPAGGDVPSPPSPEAPDVPPTSGSPDRGGS